MGTGAMCLRCRNDHVLCKAQDEHELYARFYSKWSDSRPPRRRTPSFEEFQEFEPTHTELVGFGFTESEV